MTMKKCLRVLCIGLLALSLCAFAGCTETDDDAMETISTSGDVTERETSAASVAETESATDAESMTESETAAVTELATETETATVTEIETATETETESPSVTETESETDVESATETESATATQTETETEVETTLPAYAELECCYFNYECVKSINEVEADGIYHEEEWEEAHELVINNDSLADWGRWQAGPPIEASDLSVTFKLKWDENYLYLLEIRTDTKYVYEFGNKGYDVFSDVWGGDATAFFFCDGADDRRENRCDIGYFTYVDKLEGPAVYVGSFDGEEKAFRGPSGTDDCTYGGTYDEDTATAVFEIKLPWAIMENQGKLISDIEPGTLFRFNPIIPSVDTTEGLGTYGEEWRQINFHDCVNNGDYGDPDDPFYWAALTLVEPAVAE